MTLDAVLDKIEAQALGAGAKAEAACAKSKYSIQDYWLCVEFKFQQLFNEVAAEAGLSRRCRRSTFRDMVAVFWRTVISARETKVGREQQPTAAAQKRSD